MALLDPKDGGLLSRKFILTAMSILGFFAFGAACGKWPALAAAQTAVSGAVLGALGLYFGASGYHSKLLKDVSAPEGGDEQSPDPAPPPAKAS